MAKSQRGYRSDHAAAGVSVVIKGRLTKQAVALEDFPDALEVITGRLYADRDAFLNWDYGVLTAGCHSERFPQKIRPPKTDPRCPPDLSEQIWA